MKTKTPKIKTGWHFLREDMMLRYSDGRTVKKGIWMKARNCIGGPILCKQGMHASENILDAIQYAPGIILCKVNVRGNIITSKDKFVGMERVVLDFFNCRETFERFCLWCYERALKKCGITNETCWKEARIRKQVIDKELPISVIRNKYSFVPYGNTRSKAKEHIHNLMRYMRAAKDDDEVLYLIKQTLSNSRAAVGFSEGNVYNVYNKLLEKKETSCQRRKLIKMIEKTIEQNALKEEIDYEKK